MYRGRQRVVAGLALGVAFVIGGCGDPDDTDPAAPSGGWSTAGCAVPRVPQRVTVGNDTVPVTPPRLEAVMNAIDKAGRAEFAASFAGLEVDQERVRAIVFRVPSAAFDDFIRKSADDACIVVHDAAHSTRELAVWHDRVLADLPYWTHRGVQIVSIGARHDGTGVEIGARDPGKARSELVVRYGPHAPLIFVESGPIRPLPAQTSRIAPPPGI